MKTKKQLRAENAELREQLRDIAGAIAADGIASAVLLKVLQEQDAQSPLSLEELANAAIETAGLHSLTLAEIHEIISAE